MHTLGQSEHNEHSENNDSHVGTIEIKKGTSEVIEPSETIKYPYVLHVPEDLSTEQPTNVLLWSHGSKRSTNLLDIADKLAKRSTILRGIRNTQTITVTPILPRARIGNLNLDSQILAMDTMVQDSREDIAYFQRPDIEILKIIGQIQRSLIEQGFESKEKFVAAGVSAGAVVANRLALLYPEKIQAVAILSAGDYMYPLPEIDGFQLSYPFGTSNIETITGKRFDFEEFSKIQHFLYVGSKDTEIDRDPLGYETNGNRELELKLRQLMGGNQYERGNRYIKLLKELGINVQAHIREDLGHEPDQIVMKELTKFLMAHR